MVTSSELLQQLSVAAYTTDAEGRITCFNEGAAALWGRRPELGSDRWCGAWRLYWPDGRPMPHEECPLAMALKSGQAVHGLEAVAERPDGTRVPFMPFPTALKDDDGTVTGAVNLLIETSDRKQAEMESARLSAIVSSSTDAIISKTLDGIITSWNGAATRIFGYEPEEMIGQPITRLIPDELLHEETEILSRLRSGKRIENFDTVRVGKDGHRIDISLTISPMYDRNGRLIGASKIAHEIGDRKQSEALQRLLFEELNHRVKNTLATVQAIATQSLRTAPDPAAFVTGLTGRIQALARAHDLVVAQKMKGAAVAEIVRDQVMVMAAEPERVHVAGPHVLLEARVAVELALVMHELATNARKYGAMQAPEGRLSITWDVESSAEHTLALEWRESGVKDVRAPQVRGFGTRLIERSLQGNEGVVGMRYGADGVVCSIRLPLRKEAGSAARIAAAIENAGHSAPAPRNTALSGKRILVIEDELLVALDIESQLANLGCVTVGPAATVAAAMDAIEGATFDAALLDANLAGETVESVAAALTRKAVPFAFSTGYVEEGLPERFRHVPLLAKPFSERQLEAILLAILQGGKPAPGVVRLRQRGA